MFGQAAIRRIESVQYLILKKVGHLLEEVKAMSAELDTLKASVEALTTTQDSAIALLGQLSQIIKDNIDDKPALLQLANDLDAQKAEMAAAIEANTPAT